jgi:hypothetical protein
MLVSRSLLTSFHHHPDSLLLLLVSTTQLSTSSPSNHLCRLIDALFHRVWILRLTCKCHPILSFSRSLVFFFANLPNFQSIEGVLHVELANQRVGRSGEEHALRREAHRLDATGVARVDFHDRPERVEIPDEHLPIAAARVEQVAVAQQREDRVRVPAQPLEQLAALDRLHANRVARCYAQLVAVAVDRAYRTVLADVQRQRLALLDVHREHRLILAAREQCFPCVAHFKYIYIYMTARTNHPNETLVTNHLFQSSLQRHYEPCIREPATGDEIVKIVLANQELHDSLGH